MFIKTTVQMKRDMTVNVQMRYNIRKRPLPHNENNDGPDETAHDAQSHQGLRCPLTELLNTVEQTLIRYHTMCKLIWSSLGAHVLGIFSHVAVQL